MKYIVFAIEPTPNVVSICTGYPLTTLMVPFDDHNYDDIIKTYGHENILMIYEKEMKYENK